MSKVFVGRRFQPAALSLMFAALLVAVTLIPGTPWHEQYHGAHGSATFAGWMLHTTGAWGLVIAATFVWAWWGRSGRLLDLAFQMSTGLWLCVAGIGIMSGTQTDRVLFALVFAVLAAGSAWLEEGDRG